MPEPSATADPPVPSEPDWSEETVDAREPRPRLELRSVERTPRHYEDMTITNASVGIQHISNDHPHFREYVRNRCGFDMIKYRDDLRMITELIRTTHTHFNQ